VRFVHALDTILKVVTIGGQQLDYLEAAARPRSTENSADILHCLSNRVFMTLQCSSPSRSVMDTAIGNRPARPGSQSSKVLVHETLIAAQPRLVACDVE